MTVIFGENRAEDSGGGRQGALFTPQLFSSGPGAGRKATGSSPHPGTRGSQRLFHFQGQRFRPCLPPGPPQSLHSQGSSGMSPRNSGYVLGPVTYFLRLPLNGKVLAVLSCLS